MGILLSFPQRSERRVDKYLVRELEKLTEQARSGELISLLYLIERRDGTKEYDLYGHYRKRPDLSFMPACTAMFSLCNFIESEGLAPKL